MDVSSIREVGSAADPGFNRGGERVEFVLEGLARVFGLVTGLDGC